MSSRKEENNFQRKVTVLQAANNVPKSKIYVNEEQTEYFEVQGINTNNVAYMTANWPVLTNFFLEGLVLRGEDAAAIYKDMITKSPQLVTTLIALCTRDENGDDYTDYTGEISKLGPLVLFDAVTEIIRLSKPKTEQQEKKFLATLNKLKKHLSKTSKVASTVIEDMDK